MIHKGSKLICRGAVFVLFTFMFLCGSCATEPKTDLIIATSANMQYAMQEIIESFEVDHKIKCQTVVSSSGKLTAQISAGAPYDLFFSADEKYPAQLYDEDLTVDTPQVYAYGHLAMWSMSIEDVKPFDLLSEDIKHVAIANPKTAPYGKAAKEMLDYYKLSPINEKLVFGESISQVNQFVMSEVVEVGITSLSVVLSPILKNKGYYTKVDPASYQPIAQSMAIVTKNEEKVSKAKAFRNYIKSPKAQGILKDYGFGL